MSDHPTPAVMEHGIVVSAVVLERFVRVLERLEERLEPKEETGGLLTVAQVAKRLGKSERDVYRLMRGGKLRKVEGVGKRTTRFRPADVDRLLAPRDEALGRRRL